MPKPKKTINLPTLNAFILLDRSGSMSDRWEETLVAINAYAKDIGKEGLAKVTLAVFDKYEEFSFDVLRDAAPSSEWAQVTSAEAAPRGWTPLFDAIGRIVALTEKKTGDQDKTVIVVMTDGHENASKETTQAGAKAMLDRCRSKGWQIVFLGADFDTFSQAASVGTNMAQAINITKGNYGATMAAVAMKSSAFRASGQCMAFDDGDRGIATGIVKP